MNFKKVGSSILELVGGPSNIVSANHCATRIRLIVKDNTLVDYEGLISIDGVLDVILRDEIQIVIGGDADKLYAVISESGVKLKVEVSEPVYNTSPTWRLAFFALNNTATNIYMMGMGYVSYYATGIAGLLVTTVGFILTAMRLWDGVTDPIVGYLIDKTDGKFGKFRPFMVIGNIILGLFYLLIFYTTYKVPENVRLIYFIFMYALYIVGYTFQTACTKAGQAVMTNDLKQRPLFGLIDIIFGSILFTGSSIFISGVLVPKYGGFTNINLFFELSWWVVISSGILTLLAVIGIWEKDRTEYFGLASGDQVSFKDYWPVIKGNRPLQMLIVAAGTDKLALSVARNATVGVMLYGIIIGDFALSGTMGLITMIPGVLITMWGAKFAGKFGQKRALVLGTQMAVVSYIVLFLFLFLTDPSQISLKNINLVTIGFIVIQIISQGAVGISGAFVIPMISDCADYETYKTGRFVPGMMGTLFSFVDKLISSLATSVIAIAVAAIGFTQAMPDVTDTLTNGIFWVTMFLYIGLPIIGWITSLFAMKFYELDGDKMAEIQSLLVKKRAESAISE